MLSALLPLSLLPALALAAGNGVVPTGPAPGDTFNEGSTCTIEWNPDTTGQWTQMNVKLMTGSNADMTVLKTIISNGDGTASPGSYSYTCPSVSPNSAIYFYEFTNGDDTSTDTWTGRFAIANQSGDTTPPPNETDGIPWGEGKLVGSSSSSNSSSSASGSSSSGSSSASTSGSSSSSSSGGSSTSTAHVTSTTSVTASSSGSSPTSDDSSGAQSLQTAGAAALAGLVAVGSLLF